MDTLAISLFSLFFFITHTTSNSCTPSSCHPTGSPQVRFPFNLFARQPDRCGLPGYNLLCNNRNQTILNLPSGEVIVKWISYPEQSIIIDPQFCLTNRINDFSLDGTPYFNYYSLSYTFFNCSSEFVDLPYVAMTPVRFDCLSGPNYSVVALPTSHVSMFMVPASCRNISTIDIPVRRYEDFNKQELKLRWDMPECGSCESNGQRRGLSRRAMVGLISSLGVPALLGILVLIMYFTKKKFWPQNQNLQHAGIALSSISITPRPTIIMGLDGPTIESYPKTVLGDSRRMPELNDGTCPICLSDYQPKDELRTIPDCNHYFHAGCIDEWLRLNATCPLCRNMPENVVAVSCTLTPSPPLASTSS